jgi:nucleoside-diphosphate-sugar epimerase
MRRIVVSGATSMLGATLVKIAISNDIEVLCLVSKNSGRINNIPDSGLVSIKYCDADEYKHLSVDGKYDVFYHFAWDKTSGTFRDDVDIQLKNVQYTLDAVRLAQRLGCTKFVGAGSQAEYGIKNELLKPETPVDPLSGYGIAKYTAGKLSGMLCNQIGLEHNWVRILSVFGPLDAAHTLIMYTINELKSGRSPELTKCEPVWDYLYCDDAASAFIAIGKKGVSGKVYTLGSGDSRKLFEYVDVVCNIVAPDIKPEYGKKEYYPNQPMYLCTDITELAKDTGWKPKTSFEEGVRSIK